MNFNANTGARQPAQLPGRKIKRVSDVTAVGPSVPTSQYVPNSTIDPMAGQSYYTTDPAGAVGFNNGSAVQMNQNYAYPPQAALPTPGQSQQPQQQFTGYAGGVPPFNPMQAQGMPGQQQFAMFQQPIVQDMAMQYGQRLADQGKQMVETQFEKWIPVTKLRYYFAVDNNYVINKLRLIFFPFIQKDWSLKYDQDNPVQPRYDINAPDLYIPAMAYITYVVIAGLILGMQNRFSPEQLGIQASSALAYTLFELIVYSIVIYVANITTNLRTLDLVAFSGYKFVIIVGSIVASIVFHRLGYYCVLLYSIVSLGLFLLRTLKTKVLQDAQQPAAAGTGITYDPYGNPQQQHFDYSTGRKRKLYFLFLIVGSQAFFSFLLSKHLFLTGTESGSLSAAL